MKRSLGWSLGLILVIAIAATAGTVASGNRPQLGLDLQGGASVVLEPTAKVDSEVLDQSIEIIRNRVDALGVAEPDISRQGDSIVVQLPGVKDQDRALAIVGQTAQLRFRPVLGIEPPEGATTTTSAPASTSTTAAGTPTTAAGATTTTVAKATTTTTAPGSDDPNAEVVLPMEEKGEVTSRLRLGPQELDGRVIKTARAAFDANTSEWRVDFELTGAGSPLWDQLAAKYKGQQIAIELDGVVKSAPTIQTDSFGGRGQITGDFGEREAKDLALVLRFGALPVQLKPQTVQKVSASLGKDSLSAGVLAGIIGLALVLLYMVLYYRALGLVVLLGLMVTGMFMFSIVSFLGKTSGLALSLAGATGIIISVGVTVDSYVVYFERLKDELRAGKTIRSSVDRGFARAYRTILAADAVSFIGAALLYLLTVGPVRGFAFFLGLSTLLDVVIAYFFTRPMVVLLGRNRVFSEARWLGVARGLAADPVVP
jgi:preprotein translocase subunit SecD